MTLLGGLVACFVVLTLIRSARHSKRALRETPPLGQFLTIEGQRLHYTVTGRGPDLVLIHGASGNLRDFTFDLVQRLAPQFRVICFDRPGLGHSSPMPSPTLVGQADLLAKAAAELGVENPLVMGMSYGGSVALAWAVSRPTDVAGLALISAPSYPWDGAVPWLYRLNSHPLVGPLARPLITAWIPQSYVARQIESVFAPQAAPDGYADYFGVGLTLRPSALKANAQHRASLPQEIVTLSQNYDRISVPIELLHGTADETVHIDIHSRRLRAHPCAHLVELPGVGHMPHHVDPQMTVTAIQRLAKRAGLQVTSDQRIVAESVRSSHDQTV